MLKIVNYILGALSILAQIFLILFDLGWIFFGSKMPGFIKKFPQNTGLVLAFAASLVATLGSLFYSQIAHFQPCELCWFQRIFMYPQVILLGMALIKKEKRIVDYSLALAVIGALISVYYNTIIYFPPISSVCGSTGPSASCAQLIIISFGYISIPLMALTSFFLIISALSWQKVANK